MSDWTMAEERIPFSKQMRLATREIHDISDALVNTKLAFAASDNSVWAEGLLVFYEIFRFLEEAIIRLKNTPVGEFNFEEMLRTEAFQKDLDFYLGKNWTDNYMPRESVAKYLLHLQEVEKRDPILLVAYIYHLYMGLLSGGQILNKKRTLTKKLLLTGEQDLGNAVTSFGNHSIASIKKKIVDTTNNIAIGLDDRTRELLLEESKKVFELNNAMVKTIKETNAVIFKKIFVLLTIIFAILLFYFLLKKWF